MRKTLNFIKDPLLASLKAKEHGGLDSLDLMCGWGRSTQVLYQWYFESIGRRCKKGGNAYMIDFTDPMVTVAVRGIDKQRTRVLPSQKKPVLWAVQKDPPQV